MIYLNYVILEVSYNFLKKKLDSNFVPEANQPIFERDIEEYDQNVEFKISTPLININPGFPAFENSQTLTFGAAKGTLSYTAPELISNQPYSFRADIYSFGVVLFFLLSGNDPFSLAKSNVHIIIGIKRGFFDSGMQKDWNGRFLSDEIVPMSIKQLMERMLDLNSQKRPFASEVRERLSLIQID